MYWTVQYISTGLCVQCICTDGCTDTNNFFLSNLYIFYGGSVIQESLDFCVQYICRYVLSPLSSLFKVPDWILGLESGPGFWAWILGLDSGPGFWPWIPGLDSVPGFWV